MEGGANVVVEAVTAGTAVVASRMSGNVGMLGDGHPGFFDVGNAAALALLLQRCRAEPSFLHRLERHGERRAALFSPDTEREALRSIVDHALLNPKTTTAYPQSPLASHRKLDRIE